jgi:hypothetical protein
MAHGDFDIFGKQYWNHHKRVFGAKIELAVATQRRPVPLHSTVVPAGMHDLRIARLPGGVFLQMDRHEMALGDPGYVGDNHIYAPPRHNMLAYVKELDKQELTLQRRVEMANQRLKTFKCLGTVYRKGAVHALADLQLLGMLIPKIVFWDVMWNEEHSGAIYMRPLVHRTVPTSHQSRSRSIVGKKSAKRQNKTNVHRNLMTWHVKKH